MSSKQTIQEPMAANILKKYKFRKEIGHGSYGTVYAAIELSTNSDVAIKKVGSRNFTEPILAKRALRELKLVQHLHGNENVASFLDVDLNDPVNFSELYLVEGLMEADLNQIIKSNQPLTEQHYQYFIYQLLRGIKWMHSAGVLHRDLKPGNLLVNSDCELRICDFGLARGVATSKFINTEYVATRYYRAPEVVLAPTNYSKAIDMWSVGCIFGELLLGRVMFKGKDYVDQLQKVFNVLGTPEDLLLGSLCSSRVMKYIQGWPKRQAMPLGAVFPNADPACHSLISGLLEFNPKKRLTAEQALAHPYLSAYHNVQDEPSHPALFDVSFEQAQSIDEIKKLIAETVADHKKLKSLPRGSNPCSPMSSKPILMGDQSASVPRYADDSAAVSGSIEDELKEMTL